MRTKKEILIAFEYVEDQIKKATEQLDSFDTQFIKIKDAILALQSITQDTQSLIPISDGIYAKATVKKIDSVIVDVGQNVAVEKSASDTIAMLESQLTLVIDYQQKLTKRLEQLSKEADLLNTELRELSKQ
jgi:prefoldin alpha subunit